MEASTPKTDDVLREFPSLEGKYRVRVLKRPRKNATVLDIREYVESDTWTGYTRRGIVIASRSDLETLSKALADILTADLVK